MIRKLSIVATLVALAGCGNQGGSGAGDMLKAAAGQVIGATSAPRTKPGIEEQLAQLAAQGLALRLEIPRLGSVTGAAPLAVNGAKVTWGAGASSLTTQSGFLIATRGLQEDLMAVEVNGFGPALASGGQYIREMEWINGRSETVRAEFLCHVSVISRQTVAVMKQSYATTLYHDVCRGEGVEFTNKYWIDGERKLRKSEQWISENVGYLLTERLSQ